MSGMDGNIIEQTHSLLSLNRVSLFNNNNYYYITIKPRGMYINDILQSVI